MFFTFGSISILSKWFCPAIIRCLRHVLKLSDIITPVLSVPFSVNSFRIIVPFSSLPIAPQTVTFAPKFTRLIATLPAPPSLSSSRSTRITGIGASGEMRSTSPHE